MPTSIHTKHKWFHTTAQKTELRYKPVERGKRWNNTRSGALDTVCFSWCVQRTSFFQCLSLQSHIHQCHNPLLHSFPHFWGEKFWSSASTVLDFESNWTSNSLNRAVCRSELMLFLISTELLNLHCGGKQDIELQFKGSTIQMIWNSKKLIIDR